MAYYSRIVPWYKYIVHAPGTENIPYAMYSYNTTPVLTLPAEQSRSIVRRQNIHTVHGTPVHSTIVVEAVQYCTEQQHDSDVSCHRQHMSCDQKSFKIFTHSDIIFRPRNPEC
jgi:hypothetical protein